MFSVDHYAISVSNPDESIKFYGKLGFDVIKDWISPDGSIRIIHMINSDFILEMFAYKEHESLPKFVNNLNSDLRVVGSKHFGLFVDNLNSAAEYLVNVGILDSLPQIVPGRLGRPYFFITDPNGIFVEIIAKR